MDVPAAAQESLPCVTEQIAHVSEWTEHGRIRSFTHWGEISRSAFSPLEGIPRLRIWNR